MRDQAATASGGKELANKGRVERLLDLLELPGYDRRLPDHLQDKALACMVDADARRIISHILAHGSATEHELWRSVLRDRERLSLRLYRLLLYRLVDVAERDPNRYVVDKSTLAALMRGLADEFRLSAPDLFETA